MDNLIKAVLMKRDLMTSEEADELIEQAREDFYSRLGRGEMPDDICQEWFGLEEDYVEDLIGL